MNTIAFQGELPVTGKQTPQTNVIQHPVLKPQGGAKKPLNASSLTADQASALKVLTFAGSKFTVAPHLKIESRFINDLLNSKDATEKASVAEMLGRTRSINALTALTAQLDKKEAVPVRIAAIEALGEIGDATHEDSFIRGQLAQTLIQVYNERKKAFTESSEGSGPKLSLKALRDQKQLQLNELKAILKTLGKLKVSEGSELLQKEYKDSLYTANNHFKKAEEILHAMQAAEKALVDTLEKQFKKPIQEIQKEVLPQELEELQSQIPVVLNDGSKLGFKDASQFIRTLQSQHELATQLLIGAMEGLAHQNNKQTNTYLKLGMTASHPQVKARSIEILGQRGVLSYAADIYPNLMNKHPHIRKAALNALLHANEAEAKQKTIELLNPQAFFELSGASLDEAGFEAYTSFLAGMAQNGDRYVEPLKNVAVTPEFNIQTRKIALLVLAMVAQQPDVALVSSKTAETAADAIRKMSLRPSGSDRGEKSEISLHTTKLWLGLKEPMAIQKAFLLLVDPYVGLEPGEEEEILSGIFEALQQKNGETEDTDKLKHGTHRVLPSAGEQKFSNEALANIKKILKPTAGEKLLETLKPNALNIRAKQDGADESVVKAIQTNLDAFRPVLLHYLDNETSPVSRMVAARILGLLQDAHDDTVNKLIENTRDPLKGLLDWDKDQSMYGNPSYRGANIRANNLMALGQIGDAKALPVMLDALDDPVLRGVTLGPLGQLAKAVNRANNTAQLQNVQEKLVHIMSNPDTTRAARATRIAAANALFQFNGGTEAIKGFIQNTQDLNFKRHAISALIANDYAVDPGHPDHDLVKGLLYPGLGVERLHQKGVTGKGTEIAIIDGGYVDKGNWEAFQRRVRLPARARDTEHTHPTMVATTAAGNGKIKGVAPEATIYSDKWPDLGGSDPMEVYKKIIEGKLRGENNIRVINNSWGLTSNNAIIFKEIRDVLKEFKKVVDMAEKAGIQIVFSAGNEGEELGFPSIGTLSLFGLDVDKLTDEQQKDLDYILDKVILVGATNTQGSEDRNKHLLAEFSSLGDSLNRKLIPTVVAPGVDMMVYGYEEGKRYKDLVNGTSFSGPYVSGLVSLMFQVNPKLRPDQVRNILKVTSVKLPNLPDTYQGYGEVDPHAAVERAKNFGRRRKVVEEPKTEKPKVEGPETEEPKAKEPKASFK